MLKIDYEELMQYYEVADNGEPGDGEYEDAVDAIVCRVPFIVKEHKELIAKNKALQEDIDCLKQSLEWRNSVVTDLCEKLKQIAKE